MSYSNIPIVIVLWQHSSYGGIRCPLLRNTPNLTDYGFNDMTSAIGIHPGPNYDPNVTYRVGFFEASSYRGCRLVLAQGAYPCVSRPYNFSDIISSVRIYPPLNGRVSLNPVDAPTIRPIPLVVELYQHSNYRGRRLNVVENIPNIHSYANFGDLVTTVRVTQGPNYTSGIKTRLFRDVNYRGGYVELDVGNYPNIGTSHGFNDVVSSIKIR